MPSRDEMSGGREMFKSMEMEEGLLSQRAAEQIRQLIRDGELAEGDRLPSERELAEFLGVSRTVVREAIKLLRAAGLVRVRLGVGSFVTRPPQNILEEPMSFVGGPDSQKLADLQQAREVFEPAIAALAAANASAEDIAKMERAVVEMEANIADGLKYIEWDNIFHSALAEATKNRIFQMVVHSLVDLLQESRRLAVSSRGAADRASRYHRRILEAVRSKDPEEARRAMDEHMRQINEDIDRGLSA